MSWKVSVVNREGPKPIGGDEIDLSDGVNYLLTGIDGIANAPAARIVERGPLQHGESDLGFRLQPRKIVLSLLAKGGDDNAWFARREELLRLFHPDDGPVQLRITTENMTRQIDCYLSGMMEMPPEIPFSWQKVGIELYCPDPTWYDPVPISVPCLIAPFGGGQLTIPLDVPTKVGASSVDRSVVIQYTGTWDAFPIVTINGPVTNALIQNNTLGDKLDFTGITIAAGDSYVIDCRYGRKTVTRTSDGANRIMDLTADSNLATFRIGAPPTVPFGINSIRVRGSGLTNSSSIFIAYNTRFIGV